MKNLLSLIFVFGMIVTGFAQKEAVPVQADKAEKAVQRLTKELDLTAEQQTKVRALYQEKMSARTDRKEEAKPGRKAARMTFQQELNAILTPEQVAKKTALKENRRENARANRGKSQLQRKKQAKGNKRLGGMTPEMVEQRAQKATDKLDRQVKLSETQQASAKQAYLDFYQKNQAIANDQSATPDERKEQFKSLKKSHREDLDVILTPEQRKAKKAHKMSKKGKGKKHGKRSKEHKGQQQH